MVNKYVLRVSYGSLQCLGAAHALSHEAEDSY